MYRGPSLATIQCTMHAIEAEAILLGENFLDWSRSTVNHGSFLIEILGQYVMIVLMRPSVL